LKKVKIFLSLSDEREYSVAYVITQKIKWNKKL
jgi:phosphopantetheinyl transferase (holo-ACP synthase)